MANRYDTPLIEDQDLLLKIEFAHCNKGNVTIFSLEEKLF